MASKTASKSDGKDAADASDIMSHQEMKPILNVAYNRPVSCALALTDDDEAAFLLHRKTPPKKLRTILKDDAEEKGISLATKVFFGHVKVNASNLVTITVNRELPGGKWEKALRIPLRKAGYPDFVITTDAAVEDEAEEEDEEDAKTLADARGRLAGRASTHVGTPPPVSGQEAGRRIPQELVRRLGGLVKMAPSLIAQLPSQKDRIRRLATKAIDMVKDGDSARATNAVNELDSALRAIPDWEKAETARVKAVVKSAGQALDRIGHALAGKTDKLFKEAQATHPNGGLDDFYNTQVRPAARKLADCGLDRQLDALTRTDEPAERTKLLKQTLSMIESLDQSVHPDPVFAGAGDNPFAAVNIAQTTTAVLGALKKRLQPFAR